MARFKATPIPVGQGGGLADKMAKKGYQAGKYNQNLDEKTQKALGAYMAIGGNAIQRHNKKKQGAGLMGGSFPTIHPYDNYNPVENSVSEQTGTSIFDPVLCELVYKWFCIPQGNVLDPFAGGSVRGIVATYLGYAYTGIDLSEPQIQANRQQAEAMGVNPVWIVGDSRNVKEIAKGEYDLVFSCPPYYDLEVYSDNPDDLSVQSDYEGFINSYRQIISDCISMLKDNRFACFVVGDIRDKKGFYRNFVSDTIKAFQDAGALLYNEAILVTVAGSLPVRATRPFVSGRKLGKTHQNVLVFYKGDPKLIKDNYGDIEIEDFEDYQDLETGNSAEAANAELTPIETVGDFTFKRDDLYSIAGVCGGKARTAFVLSQGSDGLITAGSRQSPQVNIVAHIAKYLGIPCRVHTPTGQFTQELKEAKECGAEIVQHKAGYNNVICARAKEDAEQTGWTYIPFGMECKEAIRQTRSQVANIPIEINRIICVVGSGMSLAGILWGLIDNGLSIPVVGIQVGADPSKRLDKYAPSEWRSMVEIKKSTIDYHTPIASNVFEGISLDPIYEAKLIPYIQKGDLVWIIGCR